MEKMRTILKNLMEKAGHNPYDIQRLTGLPAPTTYRFLDKKIDQPKVESIKAWCRAYGVTEAQLRGDMPIKGMDTPTEKQELKDLLTLPEVKLISNIQRLDEESRDMIFRMAERLALSEEQDAYCAGQPRSIDDRRQVDVFPNPQLRMSDRHKSPPRQRRLKNASNDGRHFSKSSQIA